MRKAVFYDFLIVALISLAICSGLFSYFFSKQMLNSTKDDMKYSLLLMDYSFDYDNDIQEQITKLAPIVLGNTARITVIDFNGNVIADTEPSLNYNENHLDRPEVKDAINKKNGASIRYSETVQNYLLYIAHKSDKRDYILRLSIPYNGSIAFISALTPSLIMSIIISFIIAFFIANKLSRSVTEPLNEITCELMKIQNSDEKIELKNYKYDELTDISKTVRVLNERIDKNVERLKYEKSKMDYILDNMNEGLILIDENKEVITINQSAMSILGCKNRTQSIKNIVHYTQNLQILDGVNDVLEKGQESKFDINNNFKTFAVHITKIKKGVFDKTTAGAIVLLVDVTGERENLKIRQEFFSNASHELKTPITSIQGYAELLSSNLNYNEEQKIEFLRRIKTETQNMAGLINDILMISRLEAGTQNENITDISIKAILDEISKSTEPMRNENCLNMQIECEDIFIKADYNQIYQMMNNLIINAIKYNKINGSINIISKAIDNDFYFEVSDTGIGIPLESQQRVFERFYRVDKGRSKKMGGTGLGLSIVKHIIGFYNGNIKLKSELDKGTTIIVTIPNILVY